MEIFEHFDTDFSGEIDVPEFVDGLKRLGIYLTNAENLALLQRFSIQVWVTRAGQESSGKSRLLFLFWNDVLTVKRALGKASTLYSFQGHLYVIICAFFSHVLLILALVYACMLVSNSIGTAAGRGHPVQGLHRCYGPRRGLFHRPVLLVNVNSAATSPSGGFEKRAGGLRRVGRLSRRSQVQYHSPFLLSNAFI